MAKHQRHGKYHLRYALQNMAANMMPGARRAFRKGRVIYGRFAHNARARMVTLRKKGKKPIRFKEGALHRQLGVPAGEKIPEGKMRAAAAGRYGPLAQRRARFALGLLAKGRRTAARRRR
jgi:hypothetical protein